MALSEAIDSKIAACLTDMTHTLLNFTQLTQNRNQKFKSWFPDKTKSVDQDSTASKDVPQNKQVIIIVNS